MSRSEIEDQLPSGFQSQRDAQIWLNDAGNNQWQNQKIDELQWRVQSLERLQRRVRSLEGLLNKQHNLELSVGLSTTYAHAPVDPWTDAHTTSTFAEIGPRFEALLFEKDRGIFSGHAYVGLGLLIGGGLFEDGVVRFAGGAHLRAGFEVEVKKGQAIYGMHLGAAARVTNFSKAAGVDFGITLGPLRTSLLILLGSKMAEFGLGASIDLF